MSFKSRLIRILLITTGVAGFAGYFTFSTFLFSPLESAFEADVAALVPRDVDFFGAKAGLREIFDEFPRLATMDQVEKTEAWETFADSPEYQRLLDSLGWEQALADLEANLASIPIGIQPQEVFGGGDVAVAGYLLGSRIDWAVYGRVNWAGKLAVALLDYPGLIGLEAQGMQVTSEDDRISVQGGQLAQPLHLTRVQDVVVISSSAELVAKARELAVTGENSMLQSARYFDHIQNNRSRGARGDEIELYVDVQKLMPTVGLTGKWPDPTSESFGTALTGRLFQLPSCREMIGVLDIDEGLSLDVHGELSSDLVTSVQGHVYRQRGFERAEVMDVARMVPADALAFVYLKAPIGELLGQVLESFEPALRSNLQDAFRSTGVYQTLDEVVEQMDDCVRGRLALIVRENDYPPEMKLDPESGEKVYDGPPHDGSPVFAIALVTWLEDRAAFEELRDLIGRNGSTFGLQGRNPGDNGYWQNVRGGFQMREFWSPFIPGTGAIASVNASEHGVIANHIEMPIHLLKTYSQGGSRYPRLADRPEFEGLLNSSLHDANALVWFAPRNGTSTLKQMAERWAVDNVQRGIDWDTLRAKEEVNAIAELFPGKTRGRLTPAEQEQLDAVVDPRLSEYGTDFRREQVPVLMAEKVRQIVYLESISGALAMLSLDPKSFELSVRVITPLEE